jgi:DtxR family Mn-dependent transcriptional regulator
MSGADQYLLAVYVESEAGSPPISSGTVADRLNRSVSTVTGMFERLDDQGLLVHERYEGATLTPEGRTRAEAVHESYVTLSWFFRSVLDLESHEREAMELAGVIDPSVAARLTTVLPVEDLPEGGP